MRILIITDDAKFGKLGKKFFPEKQSKIVSSAEFNRECILAYDLVVSNWEFGLIESNEDFTCRVIEFCKQHKVPIIVFTNYTEYLEPKLTVHEYWSLFSALSVEGCWSLYSNHEKLLTEYIGKFFGLVLNRDTFDHSSELSHRFCRKYWQGSFIHKDGVWEYLKFLAPKMKKIYS